MQSGGDRRRIRERGAARRPRTLAAALALASMAPAAGCSSEVRRVVDPSTLTRLDGFRYGHTVTLLDVHGGAIEFDDDSELEFEQPAGVDHRLDCVTISIKDSVLTCADELGFHKFVLRDMQHVHVVESKTSVAGTGGAIILVGLGLLVLVGIAQCASDSNGCTAGGDLGGRPLRTARDLPPTRALVCVGIDGRRGARRARSERHRSHEQEAAALHWADEASGECASIPAFGALARDLRRAGASAGLVRAALRAAREEATHTRLCTTLASRAAGQAIEAIEPPVPAAADVDHAALVERLALESFWDGCVAEGTAASIARRSAPDARDADTRDALALIARDEASHAALARDVLAFCRATGGRRVRAALAHSLEQRRAAEEARLADAPAPPAAAAGAVELLRAHGVPDAPLRQRARIEVWDRSVSAIVRA